MQYEQNKVMPEASFKAGAVTAAVWANNNGKGTFFTVSLKRDYKDKDDKWKSTTSMRVNDLPKAEMVLKKAYEFIVVNGQDSAAA